MALKKNKDAQKQNAINTFGFENENDKRKRTLSI